MRHSVFICYEERNDMARNFVQLDTLSEVFRVHPRTILRALTGEHNTYWADDPNVKVQRISIDQIAAAYNTTARIIRAVLEDRDDLLKPDEAAKVVGIRPRTFREHVAAGKFKKIGAGGIARYQHSKLIRAAIDRME